MSFTHNFHQPPVFYINGIKYINDYDLDEYRPQVQAFLSRRRTTKREIRNNHLSFSLLFSPQDLDQ